MISNYRPIAILSNISKIFDTLIYWRLSAYFFGNSLLSENQYGFRKERSTELAVCELVNRILPSFKSRMFAMCVFLDYRACFDTIPREILLSKISRYGVGGNSLQMLKSYFEGRTQHVLFNEMVSGFAFQNLGVVQGSKMGPLFYDIFSNDLNFLCNNLILYADDTCLTYFSDSLEELELQANNQLSLFFDW